MKLLKYTVAFVLFVSFTACGPTVSTTKQAGVNLSKFNTFAYLPNTGIEVPKQNETDEDVNELVIKTINANLQDAGYSINRNNPDLLVLVSTKIDFDSETIPDATYASYPYTAGAAAVSTYYGDYYYAGYSGFGNITGYNTDSYSYKEGTVVVDIVDRKTKKSVWKGSSSESIYDENQADAIANLVNEIFKKYPLIENSRK
jgi:hypothetical protein